MTITTTSTAAATATPSNTGKPTAATPPWTRNAVEAQDYYSIAGCMVAYFCIFSNTAPLGCTAADRQSTSAKNTSQCGCYKCGWATSHTVQGNDLASYGYEDFCKWPGSHFCGHGPRVKVCYEGFWVYVSIVCLDLILHVYIAVPCTKQ